MIYLTLFNIYLVKNNMNDLLIENLDSHSPLDQFAPILCNLTIDYMVVNKDGSFVIYSKEYKNRACRIYFLQALFVKV